MKQEARHHPWLHRYALLLVVATFLLVVSGGNVTSRDAGLAVPDGFTVYGYFLWAFPVDQWVGNIFHEHIHRLKGSVIGLMTIGLAVWMWRAYGAGDRRRWIGLIMLALVVLQGVLGGLRVEVVRFAPVLETPYRVSHAVTGQLVLCVTVLVAVVTSRLWHERVVWPANRRSEEGQSVSFGCRVACFALLAVLLVQLVLGAVMRHTGSGLAIPDFPASYGGLMPPLTTVGIQTATDAMLSYEATDRYFTPAQVGVAFAHRLWAVAVMAAVGWLMHRLSPIAAADDAVRAPMLMLLALLVAQIGLGAWTVWSGRHPDVATAHQATGAAILAVATWLTLRVHLARVQPAVPHRGALEPLPQGVLA